MCGPAAKQPHAASGAISPAGRESAAELHHRPGGDGGGVDRPAIRGPETTVAVGPGGHGGGRLLEGPSS